MFEEVQFRRADRQVLAIPELCLAEPRIGLIGDNGSGKSTMLRLMTDCSCQLAGASRWRELDTARHRKDLPAKVGFVFQNPDHQLIFPTVGEEVAFGSTERGIPAPQARQQAIALLERHGCRPMGGTQRQRTVWWPEAASLHPGATRNRAVDPVDG